MKRSFRAVLLILILNLGLPGCWSRRELTQVTFTGILGIDWVDGQYLISVNALSPRAPSPEGARLRTEFWTISESGHSIDGAIARIDQVLSRSLTLLHVRAVIFGEAMARRGIGPAMDFLLRAVEVRPTAWVAVTNGLARELLHLRPRQESTLVETPLGNQDVALQRSSMTPTQRLVTVANTLQEEGVDLTLPLFRPGNREAPRQDTVKDPAAENRGEIIYGGTGLFRGDRLVAWLSPEETRGHLWATDRVVHGAIPAECSDGSGRAVFRLRKGTGRVEARMVGQRVRGRIRVRVVADLNELGCADVPVPDGGTGREPLEALLRRQVKREIERALEVARSSGADPFGFGQQLHRSNPAAFRRLEKKWPEVVAAMPVEIEVTTQVPRLGQINRRFEWKGKD